MDRAPRGPFSVFEVTTLQAPIISFKDFSFQYRAQKRPTLRHINLDIYPGERVLIAGPSGSGKSTLGSCLNGLIPASYPGTVSGSLTVDGVDAPKAGVFELSRHVGTVLQDPDGQFIGLTVGEDIAFALENDCAPQAGMRQAVDRVAALVGVENHLGHAPHELSGGQKQRVSLAGVMVDEVKVLLFDEPLANLDPATGKQAIELIDEIQQSSGATVVIIEHRLEDVLWRSVDRIVLMSEGEIVADMRPSELLAGELLAQNGIREPLYLTALRYAGVDITPEKRPEHVNSLVLDDEDAERVRAWYQAGAPEPPPPERPPLLEVRGLGFGYTRDRRVLTDVSFSVARGEMLAIVGRNGAGKSTLSKLICGFETPDEGTLLMDGRDIPDDLQDHDLRRGGAGPCAAGPEPGGNAQARGGHPARVRAVSVSQLADLGAVLRAEKARDHRKRAGDGPGAHHSGRADRRAGFQALHGDHGVPARPQRPGRHGRHDYPRHAPDAGIHAARAGVQRRAAHCGPLRRLGAVRS